MRETRILFVQVEDNLSEADIDKAVAAVEQIKGVKAAEWVKAETLRDAIDTLMQRITIKAIKAFIEPVKRTV